MEILSHLKVQHSAFRGGKYSALPPHHSCVLSVCVCVRVCVVLQDSPWPLEPSSMNFMSSNVSGVWGTKKSRKRFNEGAAAVVGHRQSLWKAAPERGRRA